MDEGSVQATPEWNGAGMTIAAEITPGADETVGRAPHSTVLWAISAAGLLAAAYGLLEAPQAVTAS
jgi:hypothetical protein